MFIRNLIKNSLGPARIGLFTMLFGMFVSTGSAQVASLQFGTNVYRVLENSIRATIDVTRTGNITNGVTVRYRTFDATAVENIDYVPVDDILIFPPGVTNQSFNITILNDTIVNGSRSFYVRLSNASPPDETTLGIPSEAVVAIDDDDELVAPSLAGSLEFSHALYTVGTMESVINRPLSGPDLPGARVTVVRRGGHTGRIMVDIVREGVSTNFGTTPTTITLDDHQMSYSFVVPVFRSNYTFQTNNPPPVLPPLRLRLANPRPAPGEDPTRIIPSLGAVPTTQVSAVINEPLGGSFSFARSRFRINERARDYDPVTRRGVVRIYVTRSAPFDTGVSVSYRINWRPPENALNTFPLEPGSDYASPGDGFHSADYEPVEGTLTWPDWTQPGWADLRFFDVPIFNDNEVEFNEDMLLQLHSPTPDTTRINPDLGRATLTILYDNQSGWDFADGITDFRGYDGGEQPAGAVDRTYNPDLEQHTNPPYNPLPGANNTVNALVVQPDGKAIIGGDFTRVNSSPSPRNRIARMNADGSLDLSFNPGTGADGNVEALALQPDGKVIVAGGFTSINGTQRYSIARLNPNGTVDNAFNPGLGANNRIRTVSLLDDGKMLVGGDFTAINGTNKNYIARLNPDGTLDPTFNTGSGPNGPVHSIAVHAGPLFIDREASGGPAEDRFTVDTGSNEGTITINYDFLFVPDTLRVYYAGQLLYDSGLVNGAATVTIPYGPGPSTTLEIVLNEGSGLFGTIWFYSLFIDPFVDPRPVIGGSFTSVDGLPRNYVARLTLDGSVDTTFNPGTGANNVVHAVAKQGNKVLMGGTFTSVDERLRNRFARLNPDGSLDLGHTPGDGADDDVYTIFVQRDGKALIGGLFTEFNQTRRVGIARLHMDGTVDTSFMDTAYNQFAGLINRHDFEPENFVKTLTLHRTAYDYVTNIVENIDGNVTTNLVLTNVVFDRVFIGGKFSRVGGGYTRDDVRARNNFAALIGGETLGPGNIEFLYPEYAVDENSGSVFITLQRKHSDLGPISASFETQQMPAGPGVATEGADYFDVPFEPLWISTWPVTRMRSDALLGQNNAAFFARGNSLLRGTTTSEDVYVFVEDDNEMEGDEMVGMRLSVVPDFLNLGNEPIPLGTALGRATATLTIADNDFHYGTLGFERAVYTVTEDQRFATITVTREGGSIGPVTVDYAIANGTATAGQDYTIVRGTLSFASGQTTNSFTIPIMDDLVAELEESVNLFLFNPAGFPLSIPVEQRLDPARASARLIIIDNDYDKGRVSFTTPTISVPEDSGIVTLQVQRIGGNVGELLVDWATENGTAIAPVDYVSTNGSLYWPNKDTSPRTIQVRINNNEVIEGEKTFTVRLSNARVSGVRDDNALGFQRTIEVTITNDDFPGDFRFSQSSYLVDENGGEITVTVLRLNGSAGTNQVSFLATNLTAIAGLDFVATNGVLNFTTNETSKSFTIRILDDAVVEGDKEIALFLTNAVAGTVLSATSTVVIIDDELMRIPAGSVDTTFNQATGADAFIYSAALQPNGRVVLGGDFEYVNDVLRPRLARLNSNGSLDRSFDPAGGANGSVRSVVLQPDNRILIGGLFTTVNNTNRNHIARLNVDGSIDPTFNPGSGADNSVYAVALQPNNRILIGGDFSRYNGIPRSGLARLQTNGVLDLSFDVGTGANGRIYAIAVQSDGRILVGGDFTTFNGVERPRLARLLPNGSLDTSFQPGTTINNSVRAIVVQPDGKVLVGGLFTPGGLLRLLPNGSLDPEFNPGTGANGPINTIALQADGKILVGGGFTSFNDFFRGRIARLTQNGRVDPTINFGSGVNAAVSSIVVQPDRKIILVGGFTEYNGDSHPYIVRIHGGSLGDAGAVEFTSAIYRVSEAGAQALVTIRRIGGLNGTATVQFETIAGNARAGTDFTLVTTNLVFREGETHKTVLIPVMDDTAVDPVTKIVHLQLRNPTGTILGPQPTAQLIIESDDSVIQFSAAEYSVTENFVTGSASITVQRLGSTALASSVTVRTQDGTAISGLDYVGMTNVINFAPGEASRTFAISLIDDALIEGNEFFTVILTNLTGQAILGTASARVTIVDNEQAPGRLSFANTNLIFSASESDGRIVVTVRRSEGFTGEVSVDYATSPLTATPLVDYNDVRGILSFGEGELEKSFFIPILDDDFKEGNEEILITLSNPRGGATILGSATARARIIDDDLGAGSLDEDFNPGTGANGTIRAIQLQGENFIIGGDFTAFNGVTRSRVARLSPSGSLDLTFDPGVGPNNYVAELLVEPGNTILISGQFTTVSGVIHNRVARLSPNGTLDPSLNLPLGLNGEVSEILLQANDPSTTADDKIVIGGVFNMASAAGRNRIARLNRDGTVDLSFDPGIAADNTVHALAQQSDGKLLVGGAFSTFNGFAYRGIVRLNSNGSIDHSFNPGFGVNGPVRDILLQPDGGILISGDFTAVNGTNRVRVARLNRNGSLDLSFNTEGGPNGIVHSMALQRDGKIFIGGDFTAVNGTNRVRLARLQTNGRLDPTFETDDGLNSAVLQVLVQPHDQRVVVVGGFTLPPISDRRPARMGIARFNNDPLSAIPDRTTLRISSVEKGTVPGRITLRINTQVGATYVIEASNNLVNWTPVQTIVADNVTATYTDTTGEGQRYYRVRLVQ